MTSYAQAIKAPVQELKRLLGPSLLSKLRSRFPEFNVRAYQVLAVHKLLWRLRRQENSLLLLDPGLGKTLVSQITFLALSTSKSKVQKAIILVPSRLLRDQHYRAASWFSVSRYIMNIDEQTAKIPTKLRDSFERANWIITTPKRFWNALQKDYRLRQLLREISLCIVDEFDAHASEDVDEEGEPIGRLSKAAIDLVAEIKSNGALFLCMSATQRTAAQPWLEIFDLKKVTIPDRLIHRYSAFVKLDLLAIHDDFVTQADGLINLVVVDCLRKMRKELTDEFLLDPEIDPDRLQRQATRIKPGIRERIYFPFPIDEYVNIYQNPKLKGLIGRFLQAYAERLFLYEGRLSKIELETYKKYAIDNLTGEKVPVDSVGQVSYDTKPSVTQKLQALLTLIMSRIDEKCLVLVRNTDINYFIFKFLLSNGIKSSSLIGEMTDKARRESLERFEHGKTSVLIANRQLGGRGFDLPIAEYAIFLSPKRSAETMWQEMLRIRSSKRKPKDVYVMYYSHSKERPKMSSLLEEIKSDREKYKISIYHRVPISRSS